AILAYMGTALFDSWLAGLIAFGFVTLTIAALWAGYLAILWVFAREALQSVEIGDEGIRERRAGREFQFIPWAGVKEIEIAATIIAGASLRVKGNFSEISISNVDLMITGPMGIREMHRAFRQTSRLRELFEKIKLSAPKSRTTMTRLARRRLKSGESGESF
ncbi:MAG TPA: hypothetical protein VNO14_10945, partial [Blastocatellia bacterium]|nr:hypothetical protein [Blastocatellia bacterium]